MKTLLLSPPADPRTGSSGWDLLVDGANNIAVASEPYSQAQDAASNIGTYEGEVYYNTALGLPYFSSILGQVPPISLIKANMVAAALLVPGVVSAQCFITSFVNRRLRGQVQIKNDQGVQSAAGF